MLVALIKGHFFFTRESYATLLSDQQENNQCVAEPTSLSFSKKVLTKQQF